MENLKHALKQNSTINPHMYTSLSFSVCQNFSHCLSYIPHFCLCGDYYGVLNFKINPSVYILLLRFINIFTQYKQGHPLENEIHKNRWKFLFMRLTSVKTISNLVPFPLHLFSHCPFTQTLCSGALTVSSSSW